MVLIQSLSASSASGSSLATPSMPGVLAGDMLAARIFWKLSGGVTVSVSDSVNGAYAILPASAASGNGNTWVWFFFVKSAASSPVLTATFTGTVSAISILWYELAPNYKEGPSVAAWNPSMAQNFSTGVQGANWDLINILQQYTANPTGILNLPNPP